MAVTPTFVNRAILIALSNAKDDIPIFDLFIEECQKIYETGAHSIQDLRQKCTKTKGDIFEAFTVIYLEKVLQWEKVWLLKDIPDDILVELSLGRRDMGIDIVGYDQGNYYAVQCKYKKRNPHKKYTTVSWKELSTFQSLCSRTGPWYQQIVVTNCDYVHHQGQKLPTDKTIAKKTLQNLKRVDWLAMIGDNGHQLVENEEKIISTQLLTTEEIRAKRLAYFNQQP